MLRHLLIMACLLVAGDALSTTLRVDPLRTVRVVGEVDGSILQQIQEIDHLSRQSDKPIFLLINSPGGSILAGNLFINAMNAAKERGVKFHCASTLITASMAFQFFVECNYRYALPHAKLLFHPPRIFYMGVLLEEQMRSWIQELDHIENKMTSVMKSELGMDDEVFDYHYHAETLWDAEDLRDAADSSFLRIVDDIAGISNIFQWQPQRGSYSNGQLIWIYDVRS